MAYTNNAYEVDAQPFHSPSGAHPTANQFGTNLAATGVRAEWVPGLTPHRLHSVGIVPSAQPVRTNAVSIKVKADISAQGTATDVGTIVLPTTVTAAGEVVYWRPTHEVDVPVGRTVQFSVTAAATAGSYAHVKMLVSPCWDNIASATNATSTT